MSEQKQKEKRKVPKMTLLQIMGLLILVGAILIAVHH